MKRILSLLIVSILLLGIICGTTLAAPSKTNPAVIVEVTHDGTPEDWTVSDPSVKLTMPEASRISGDPETELAIIWQKDFSTKDYPAKVHFNVPETDQLKVYVFQYYDDAWHIIATVTGPDFVVTVDRDGPIAIVPHSKKTGDTSPKTGVESLIPLALTTFGCCGAVLMGSKLHRKFNP